MTNSSENKKEEIDLIRDEYWQWDQKELSDKTALGIAKVMNKTDRESDKDIRKFHSGSYLYKVSVRWRVYKGRNILERIIFALTNKIYHGQIVILGKTIEF
jgi:hypothetical protein